MKYVGLQFEEYGEAPGQREPQKQLLVLANVPGVRRPSYAVDDISDAPSGAGIVVSLGGKTRFYPWVRIKHADPAEAVKNGQKKLEKEV